MNDLRDDENERAEENAMICEEEDEFLWCGDEREF